MTGLAGFMYEGSHHFGSLEGERVTDLGADFAGRFADLSTAAVRALDELFMAKGEATLALDEVKLLAPRLARSSASGSISQTAMRYKDGQHRSWIPRSSSGSRQACWPWRRPRAAT